MDARGTSGDAPAKLIGAGRELEHAAAKPTAATAADRIRLSSRVRGMVEENGPEQMTVR